MSQDGILGRRRALGLIGAAACWPAAARAQGRSAGAQPPSVISMPPRQWGPNADPVIYPDPDILILDPSFQDLLLGITQIRRIWDRGLWLEGPAWSSQGQYLVFSDVQADRQYRYIWETGEVTPFRAPSFNSNGNAFDFQGRQIVCEDLLRRIVRHEHDGTVTVLADSFEGRGLNSPNDIAVHRDGSIWFTDPAYGDTLSEGHPDFAGGPTNADGRLNPRIGAELAGITGGHARGPGHCYRIDADGSISKVIDEKDLPDPNGIAFSPDFRTLYVASTGRAPGDTHAGGASVIYAFDVTGKTVTRQRLFSRMTVDGVKCSPDGFRADVSGNLWCGVNGPFGYGGVQVLSPAGRLIGRIRLPQLCANLTFAGPKRNMLMMCCGQSLYALQVQTQGAAPG
jgi:gluconolactonase